MLHNMHMVPISIAKGASNWSSRRLLRLLGPMVPAVFQTRRKPPHTLAVQCEVLLVMLRYCPRTKGTIVLF